MLAYLCMLRWAVLLKLKEPCLWRDDQILQSNMYEAARLYTHTWIHISTQTQATLETPQWHRSAHEGIDKHGNTISPRHSREGIQMIYLQFSTCTVGALGVSGVRSCMRNNGPLHLSASSNQTTKHKDEPTEGIMYISADAYAADCHQRAICY